MVEGNARTLQPWRMCVLANIIFRSSDDPDRVTREKCLPQSEGIEQSAEWAICKLLLTLAIGDNLIPESEDEKDWSG